MNWKNSSKLSSLVDAGLHSRQPSSLSKVVGLGAEPRASCTSDKLSTTKPCPQLLVQGVWCSQKHFCFIGAKEFSVLHLLDASSLCRISNRGKKAHQYQFSKLFMEKFISWRTWERKIPWQCSSFRPNFNYKNNEYILLVKNSNGTWSWGAGTVCDEMCGLPHWLCFQET